MVRYPRLQSAVRHSVEFALRLKYRTRVRTRFYQGLRWLDAKLYDLRKTGYGKDTLKNLYWDRRFGGYCGGSFEPPEYAALGANAIESSDYTQLEMLFDRNGLQIHPDDVLVDVGCGKGRVINFWLKRGYRNRMIGLELDDETARLAQERLKSFPNVTIVSGDAIENLPEDGTFFYVYNPFGAPVVERFAERMAEKLTRRREARIIYNNCQHIDIFAADPRWRIEFLNVGWRRVRAAMITFAEFPPLSRTAPDPGAVTESGRAGRLPNSRHQPA